MPKLRLNELQKAVRAILGALLLPSSTTTLSAGLRWEFPGSRQTQELLLEEKASWVCAVLFLDDTVDRAELSLPVALGKENVCGK